MARYVGDQSKVVLLYESGTYASVSGTGQWPGLVTDHDAVESINTKEIRYAGNASRDVGIFVDTALDAKGKLKFNPQDWRMLFLTLGSNVDASGASVAYTHTMSATNSNNGNAFTSGVLNPFVSFTVEDSVTAPGTGLNKVQTVNGCVVENFDLSWKQGGIVEVNVDYVGQSVSPSSGTSTAVTALSNRPFLWSDVKVHIPSGTVYQEVRDGGLKIGNTLDAPHYTNGSKVIAVPIPTDRKIELSLTLDATSEHNPTLYNTYFKGGSTFNAMLEVTDVSAGAGSRDLFIVMSGCRLTGLDDPSKSSGVISQKLKIQPQTISAVAHDAIVKYNPW